MPIISPNIYYFDNSNQERVPYTKISADYDSKKVKCKLTDLNSIVKIFQKKWVLKSFDKKREIETDSDFIDFSLAQKFPNITCETLLFDGLLYKKVQESASFSSFENWPNISPGMRTYSVSSIGEFSISDYFKTKEAKQYYFCESGSEDISEKQFCSLIDRDTGGIDYKNNESQKILHLIGNEKYKIFNLTIGTKQENKIISQTGIQFLVNNMNSDSEFTKTPPKIEFINSVFSKYFICQSNLFLYYPNNKNIIWTKNGKKIPDVTDKILPQKYIEYAQSYKCANSNGESEKFVVDKEFLEINGPSQINFEQSNLNKVVQYETNLTLPEGKFDWSCQGSSNVQCDLIESGSMPGYQVKITPNEKFKKSFLHEKIKIILNVENESFEKEVVIFNYKENETVTEDISNELSITTAGSDNLFSCNIPESIQKSSMMNIYWFIDNNEAILYRNKTTLSNVIDKSNVTCIVVGKLLNKNIIGAVSYIIQDPNKKNPSWLKESYLINLMDNKKKYLFTKNSEIHSNSVYCYITTGDNYKLTNNICAEDNKDDIFLNISEENIAFIKNYLIKSQIIDLFNIPYFTLNIKIFEDEKLINLKSNVKFFIPNQKPIIYASGIFENKNNEQKCFVIAKDPQNLFLSSQFNLERNKNVKNISSFNYQDSSVVDAEDNNIINLLNRKNIYYYEYNFKFNQKEDFCYITIGNGTTISQIKTPRSSELGLKKQLISINNRTKESSSFFDKEHYVNENFLKEKYLANDDKVIISLHKSVISNPSKPFLLKFFYKNKESHLDIAYSPMKYLQNLSQLPSQVNDVGNDFYDEEDYSGTFFGYFLSARVFKKNNRTNKDYICEVSPWEYANEIQSFRYNIFLNDNFLFSKKNSKENISFEIKNVKSTDTVTCQVELDNKIESSSYTNLDTSNTSSYCYALDKNYSILSFECPTNVNINQTSAEMEKTLRNKLVSQFKILDNITYAHMTLWTQSQKNKISITTKIDEELNEEN
jgi:hypothetical protein